MTIAMMGNRSDAVALRQAPCAEADWLYRLIRGVAGRSAGSFDAAFLDDLVKAARSLCGAASAGICIAVPAARAVDLHWIAADGPVLPWIGHGKLHDSDPLRACMVRGEPVMVEATSLQPLGAEGAAGQILAVPVPVVDGQPLACLWIAHPGGGLGPFGTQDMELLKRLAGLAALGLRTRAPARPHKAGEAAADGPHRQRHLVRRHLTLREAQVLTALLQGRANKMIGKELGLSENTVKVHIAHIMRKLQARNRTELALIAQRRFHLAQGRAGSWPVAEALRSDDPPPASDDRAR